MAENQQEHVQAVGDPASSTYAVASVTLKPSSVQPQQRGGATLTQVEDGGIYLIGGANREGACFGDVHRFDLGLREWTLVKAECDEFPARSGHSAVAVGRCIYVFGGLSPVECEVYNDVHVFDTHTRKWSSIDIADGEVPMPRNAHAAVLLPTEAGSSYHRMLIYGGSSPDDDAFNDTFILQIPLTTTNNEEAGEKEPLRWEKLERCSGEKPEARELHCATLLLSYRRFASVEAWEWQLVPICEWNRCSHVAGLVDGALVSFGGFDGGAIRNDCWVYHDDAESWLRANTDDDSGEGEQDPRNSHDKTDRPEISSAAPTVLERFGHAGCTVVLTSPASPSAAASDKDKVSKQALLVFGGMNTSSDLNDLVLIEQR